MCNVVMLDFPYVAGSQNLQVSPKEQQKLQLLVHVLWYSSTALFNSRLSVCEQCRVNLMLSNK